MKKAASANRMFLDIGSVPLTDRWNHHARKQAATNIDLEWAEMVDRHHLTFETYEEGKLALEEYLALVVSYQKRPFTLAQFRRELNTYRLRTLKLDRFVGAFISSCFVHLREPSVDIFRLALDIPRVPAGQEVYNETTPTFSQIAEDLQVRSIRTDYRSTCARLTSLGSPRQSMTTINDGSWNAKFELFVARGESQRPVRAPRRHTGEHTFGHGDAKRRKGRTETHGKE